MKLRKALLPAEFRAVDFAYRLLRPLLFAGDAESAHERMLTTVERLAEIPTFLSFLQARFREEHPLLRTPFLGKICQNPLGLAAGFDKDGRIHPAMFALGFGFVEIGTVTPRPQSGNPRPRLFRLVEDEAVINRMGFNNQGAEAMAKKLLPKKQKKKKKEKKFFDDFDNFLVKNSSGMLGINIGKNKDTPLKYAAKDYLSALTSLYPFADYFTVNISSPNTDDLRSLQKKNALGDLLCLLCTARDDLAKIYSRNTPLLVKIAPDWPERPVRDEILLKDSIQIMREFAIQGVVAVNTTVERLPPELPAELKSRYRNESGGLSGKPLRERSTAMIRTLFQEFRNVRCEGAEKQIIGVGGIFNGADAYEKIKAGASALQIYTALIYEGPGLVRKIKRELADLLERDGFNSVTEAVGIEN